MVAPVLNARPLRDFANVPSRVLKIMPPIWIRSQNAAGNMAENVKTVARSDGLLASAVECVSA
jgi:hypothetical protein